MNNMRAEELRKSILQQAIQGKLVKQNPDDEPASVLLERIKLEKERLVKEGKIKKDKTESYIFKGDDNRYYEKIGKNEPVDITDDLPFEIPNNWIWIRLSSLSEVSAGGTPDRKNKLYWNNGNIPWLKISDITSANKYINTASEYITSDGLENSSAKWMKKGTILYTIFATVGEVGILNFDSTCNQAIAGINPYYDVTNYLYYFLVNLENYMKSISKGCAQLNINQNVLKSALIALPPLEEQERIVKRIEELMPLVDEYARLETKDKELDDKLPGMLKQSILQYAMEGKLVKQNPDDEPASVLLERIKIEKERLIKEGKIKRDKNETLIIQDDDKNYYENLPQNWTLTILNNISSLITKGTTPRGGNVAYSEKGIGFLRAENVTGFYDIDLNNLKFVDEDTHRTFLKRSILQESDILITIAGTLGRTGYIKKEYLPLNTNQAIAIIRPLKNVYVPYIILSLNSPKIQNELLSQKKITAIPNLTLEIISRCILPYPPLNEQIKITNKVASLFAILNVK